MSRAMVTLRAIAAPKGLQTGPFGSQLKAEEYVECGVPLVMPRDIFAGKIVADRIARVPEQIAKKLAKHRVVAGDILFPRRGDLGRIGVVTQENEGWLCGTGCLRARLKEEMDTNYIHQYVQLTSVKKWLECNALGQTMLNLSTEIIGNLPIFIVPKSEQTAIATFLSTWDLAIEKAEWLVAAREKWFTALTQELLHNCTEGLRHFHLRDICAPVTRKNDGNELNVLTTSAQHGLIGQLDYYKKSVSAEDVRGYYLLKKGEFAYNRSSSNGYPYGAIKRLEDYPQGVLSTLYLCFFIKTDAPCDSDFMAHAFEAGLLNKQLVGVCQEGARSHGLLNITKTDFFGLKISLPAITEQRRIATILTTARQEIDLLKKQAEAYRRQKRGLMQKLLTGEWRINVN